MRNLAIRKTIFPFFQSFIDLPQIIRRNGILAKIGIAVQGLKSGWGWD
jgi:hypothetical protein